MAEEKGFEPLHPVTGLRDFESRLFDHLSTPPNTALLYQPEAKKSRFFLMSMSFVHFVMFIQRWSKREC